jgi:hypothetical protein
MAEHNKKHEADRRERSWSRKIWHKLRHGTAESSDSVKAEKHRKTLSKSGQDVDSGISPSGKRESLVGPRAGETLKAV